MLLIDDRWFGSHGIGRFAQEVSLRMGKYQSISDLIPKLHIIDPLWQSCEVYRKKPEVYFNPGYNPPLFSQAPFIFTIHDLNHLHSFGNESKLKDIYYEFLIKPACHKAFKVLTVSEFSRQEIITWSGVGEDKVLAVGNACNSSFTTEGDYYQPGFPYLLYIGNHKPHKNLNNLLKGFSLLKKTDSLRLLISGVADKKLLDMIKTLGIQSQVEFCGIISDEKLPNYYRGAIALVLPSFYEGFGLPIIEAMACGTPVITSNLAAMPETSGGAALLIDPYSPEEIANGIFQIINDNAFRASLIHKGLIRAADFSWDKIAEKILNIISQAKESVND